MRSREIFSQLQIADSGGENPGPSGGSIDYHGLVKPRPLSISAFRIEAARLIGAERADEIIRTISSPDFFGTDL